VSRFSRENVGASTSHILMGLHGLLQESLYLFYYIRKGKVKFSLVLTNWELRHEDVRGSGCIDPRILDLRKSWGWLVNFTPQPLYPRGNWFHTHWIKGWVGPRTGLDHVEIRKSCPHRDSNFDPSAARLVASRYTDGAVLYTGRALKVESRNSSWWRNRRLSSRWRRIKAHGA
jgi:hypothetical protein